MPVLSKFQSVTMQSAEVTPSPIAEQLSDLGLHMRSELPSGPTVTVTPLYTRIAVQVDSTSLLSGTTIHGFIDVRNKATGLWRKGTPLYQRYSADEYYANAFNLREATSYEVRLTLRLRDASGVMVREWVESYDTTTLDSTVPTIAGNRRVVYVDAANGNNTYDGSSPTFVSGSVGPKANLDGSGTSVTDLIVATNDTGWDIYIVNGTWPDATTSTRRLAGCRGSATNWIRILPYDENSKISCERALNGTWTDEGSGVFSMQLATSAGGTVITTAATLANIYDATTEEMLYPYKTRTAFNAGAIADGTGYWIDNSNPAAPDPNNNPAYADAADILYVRLASGANPGTGRLTGAFGDGLILQDCRYVCVDGLTFRSCGSRDQSNDSIGQSAVRINSPGAGLTKNLVIRNCDFARNARDIWMAINGSNLVSDVLIEDNSFVFDGPWPHLMEQFAYTEGDPYTQADSWSHAKSSAWESHAIDLVCGSGIVVRNNTCQGREFVTLASGVATSAKHYHQHGNTVTECWDDALVEMDSEAGINSCIHNETVVDSVTLTSWSPYSSGPCWLFACSIDGYVHYPFKIGDQSTTALGHGYKIIANVSAKSKGFGDATLNDTTGMNFILGGSSGTLMSNVVLSGVQTPSDTAYWTQLQTDAPNYTVVAGIENLWQNCLFYMENRATPLVPKVRWRNGSGTWTDYASFDAASTGIDGDTVFTDCVGAYSNGGGVDPFPTTIAAGLNSLVTTESAEVRGVTALTTSSAIGAFALGTPV